jgi:hypothetical protein
MKQKLKNSFWGRIQVSLVGILIITVLSGCGAFGQPDVQGAIETGIAATRQVEGSVATRVAEALQATAVASASQATVTPPPPPTATLPAPTQALPSPTPTQSAIIGMGEVRGGPGDLFPVVNIYPQGAQFTVNGAAPGRRWMNVVSSDGKAGWMPASALRFTPPDTLPIVNPAADVLQVRGVILDVSGKPVEGVGIVMWRIPASGYMHEDGQTLKDGTFAIFLPPTLKGGWSLALSNYACTSHIMDASCNFPGGFTQGVQNITLPRTEPVAFYYDPTRKENVYWPLANAACQSLKDAIDKTLSGTKKMAEAAFVDSLTGETGKACQITIQGTGVNFPDFTSVAAKLDSILVPQSWVTDKKYDASGPTGMAMVYRKQYLIAQISIERAPAAAANCSKDKPIAECNVKPEQWQYTILVNFAEK